MTVPPKKPDTHSYFIGDSVNFPTFSVNVAVPTKPALTPPAKTQAEAPAKPKPDK